MQCCLACPCWPAAHRGGLSARPRQDHLQINIDPGSKFDYDEQLSALRGDVAKIKQVCVA
jgi:hypothetical protein